MATRTCTCPIVTKFNNLASRREGDGARPTVSLGRHRKFIDQTVKWDVNETFQAVCIKNDTKVGL